LHDDLLNILNLLWVSCKNGWEFHLSERHESLVFLQIINCPNWLLCSASILVAEPKKIQNFHLLHQTLILDPPCSSLSSSILFWFVGILIFSCWKIKTLDLCSCRSKKEKILFKNLQKLHPKIPVTTIHRLLPKT